jgi:hypothetical protein
VPGQLADILAGPNPKPGIREELAERASEALEKLQAGDWKLLVSAVNADLYRYVMGGEGAGRKLVLNSWSGPG